MEHWEWDPSTDRVTRSNSLSEVDGLKAEDLSHSGTASFGLIHPEDRERHQMMVEAAGKAGLGWHTEIRIIDPVTGEVRWMEERAAPGSDAASGENRIFGFVWDVTSRKRAEIELHENSKQLQFLVGELQHRVRNILAVVRAIYTQTLQAGGDPDDVAAHFRGRLDALARTHIAASRSADGSVLLEDLVRDEMVSAIADQIAKVNVSGPEVNLTPKMAEILGLAFHELTTNALKFGALYFSSGTLSVSWRVNPDQGAGQRLTIIWSEQGVPTVPLSPSRRGFGSELIEEALPYQLGVESRLEFRGGGVLCTIDVPLAEQDILPRANGEGGS